MILSLHQWDPLLRSVLLVFLLVLLVFLRRYTRPSFVVPPHMIDKKKQLFLRIILCILLCAWVLVMWDVRLPLKHKAYTYKQPLLFQVLMDVSLSMSADDIAPWRFVHIHSLVQDVLTWLEQHQSPVYTEVITFSGIPLIWFPFSSSPWLVAHAMSGLSLGSFPPTNDFLWTAWGDALVIGWESIKAYEQAYMQDDSQDTQTKKYMLLLTDGDNSSGVDPRILIASLQEENIEVFIVTIGKESHALWVDTTGVPVYATLDRALLQELASYAHVTWRHIDDPEYIPSIVDAILSNIYTSDTYAISNTYLQLNIYLIPMMMLFILLFILYYIRLLKKVHNVCT